MVKGWQKRIASYDKPTKLALLAIIDDIKKGFHQQYDIIPLQGHAGLFRLSKGKFRIIFSQQNGIYIIEEIDTRGDVYKKF